MKQEVKVLREKETIRHYITLTEMVYFLNERFGHKASGARFKVGDVQQYIRLEHFPRYLGNYEIERVEELPKHYNIIQEKLKLI